jgi:hypothetical protein
MNGVAVLLAAAVLGVDYGWQPTTDGQLEYIVQIEPVTLVALRGGQELISQIDPYVQGVRRFRVRVGTDMVPRRGTPPRQPAPPLSLPVPAGVQYGWRGIDSRQMEFIIQLSHERLVLMRGGEELVGEMPVELQNVTQLRIRSGVEPPPRQGLQVASATLPPENTAASGSAQPTPAPAGAPAPAWPQQSPVQPPTEAGPAIGPPPRMGTETPGPNDLRPPVWQPGEAPAPPASTAGPGQPTLADPQTSPPAGSAERYSPAAAPPNAGTNWGAAGAGALPAQPGAPAADPRFEFAAPQGSGTTQPPAAAPNPASREPAAALGAPSVPDPRATAGDRPLNGADAGGWPAASYDPPTGPPAPAGGSWTTGPVPVGSGPTNQTPLVNTSPPNSAPLNPGFADRAPGYGVPGYGPPAQNPGGTVIQGGSVYGGAPQPPAGGQQATPPTVQIPYAPQWASGSGEQSGWTVTQDPAPSSGYPIASSRPFDMTAEVPRMPWERRLFDTDSDIRITEKSKDFWANLAATAQDPTLSFLHTGSQTAAGDRPWGPLALALMVLFVSLGGNLYMGWIAMDMYQRYLELADDLTEHDSPSRPSLDDDDPLDDEDDWSEVRRRRSRASVAA